jgi:5-methylcytosine-specific restriction protein A
MRAQSVWYGELFLLLFVLLFWFFFIRTEDHSETNKPDIEVSEEVQDVPFGGERSSKWPAVRNYFVKLHPACEACGTTESLNVHHIIPFHERPELELDLANLITLCRDHHFSLGHFRNWSKYNPNVRRDAAKLKRNLLKKSQSKEGDWWFSDVISWWGWNELGVLCRYYDRWFVITHPKDCGILGLRC